MKTFIKIFVLALLSLSSNAFATDQEPETLIYKGEKLDMYDTPLNSYFTDQHKKPNIYELTKSGCSAAWREYHGTWQVKGGYLYLVDIGWPCSMTLNPKIISNAFFPNENLPIKAIWFTGYAHTLYDKKMFLMRFDKGKLIKEEVANWPPSKYGYGGIFANDAYWSHGVERAQRLEGLK